MDRPTPPKALGEYVTDYPVNTIAALDMPLWVNDTFIKEGAELFNPDHQHLTDAFASQEIGFLWTCVVNEKKGKRVLGSVEKVTLNGDKWAVARREQQLMHWFGLDLPNYIITLDADYCKQASDVEFCALVEHELYHIAQEVGADDEPKFNAQTDNPSLRIVAHDVEEFKGVVRRYGASPEVAEMVALANSQPEVARTSVARVCGNCLKLVG